MAYRDKVVTIAIPADVMENVRQLSLPQFLRNDTQKVLYLVTLGLESFSQKQV